MDLRISLVAPFVLSFLFTGSVEAGQLMGHSTLGDWEQARGDDQMALARDMLARTIGGDDSKAVDLMFCIEKPAGDPANAQMEISQVASACLVLMGG